jgi:NAD(P)-dependent dehydrogenase (short-subunit alcohol dehydrogenase family)
MMSRRRTCLITGGNAGIGRAAAQQLVEADHRVLLGCRDRARGDAAAEQLRLAVAGAEVSVLDLDMSSQRSIREAAARVDDLDVLIHNAAYFDVRAKARTETPEGIETTWATNYLGPTLLTELLLPALQRSEDARVIAVTSKGLALFPRLAVDLHDPEFKRRRFSVSRAYYQSKLAHLAWMLGQAERWRTSRVTFHGVRVTNVKIDLARYPGLAWPLRAMYAVKSAFSVSPAEMARTYVWLATADGGRIGTGGYWDRIAAPVPVSRWASNPENRAALDALTRAQLHAS